MFKKILKKFFKCRHKKALLNSNEGFCPDCGVFLKKSYYVVRCENCGIKRIAKKKFEEITPEEKFCKNCGEEKYIVEKYESLKLVDIHYAIEVIEEIKTGVPINDVEIWIEENNAKQKNSEPFMISEMKYLTG